MYVFIYLLKASPVNRTGSPQGFKLRMDTTNAYFHIRDTILSVLLTGGFLCDRHLSDGINGHTPVWQIPDGN